MKSSAISLWPGYSSTARNKPAARSGEGASGATESGIAKIFGIMTRTIPSASNFPSNPATPNWVSNFSWVADGAMKEMPGAFYLLK
jgi:hypothetical protein